MEDSTTGRCPYCQIVLEKVPKKKAACPACGEPIFVRTSADGTTKMLVTATESDLCDCIYRTRKNMQITPEQWTAETRALSGRGAVATDRDVMWSFLNRAVKQARDHHDAKMAYFQMAHMADAAGDDPKRYLQASNRADIQGMAHNGVTDGIRVEASPDSCPACKALSKATSIPMATALHAAIPPDDCTCGFSTVWVAAHFNSVRGHKSVPRVRQAKQQQPTGCARKAAVFVIIVALIVWYV